MAAWSVTDKEAQRSQPFDALLPSANIAWGIELVKASITSALQRLWLEHGATQCEGSLELLMNPKAIRTKQNFKAGALKLVPITCRVVHHKLQAEKVVFPTLNLGQIEPNLLGYKGLPSFALSPHFVVADKGKDADKDFVAPFWAVTVSKADADERVNMALSSQGVADVGLGQHILQIPIMTNTRAIKPNTILVIKSPKAQQCCEPAAKRAKT